MRGVMRCLCVWHGVPCAKEATQEDGLCDWCGVRRPEDLRSNPFAFWSPEGELLGLGGGTETGYNHQAGWDGIPDTVRPTACWMEKGRPQRPPMAEVEFDPQTRRELFARLKELDAAATWIRPSKEEKR